MVSEETLEMIKEAFNHLSQEKDLQGWGLDTGWYYQDQSTDDVQVNLLRGESERRSITVRPGNVLDREQTITFEGLMREIERQLIENGLIESV